VRFGNLELYLVNAGTFMMDGGAAFGLVPKVLWERELPADELNRVPMAANCLLIQGEGQRILVDTGMGTKLSEKERGFFSLAADGGLEAGLAKLGLGVGDIDIVINTHLHSDHCGGNTKLVDGKLVPTFPRARYWIQRREWSDALYPNERTQATYLAGNLVPLSESGQLELKSGNVRVAPSVECQVTRGHTYAHQSVIVKSQDLVAIYLGDVAPFTVHMERIAWIPAFDAEPLETVETKRSLLRWALEQRALLIFGHDTRIPMGYLRREGDGYRVEPARSW